MNLQEALSLAYEAHDGQVRKYSGYPYIIHPISVASKFEREDYKILALLHDIIEDTDVTMDELINIHELPMHLVEPLTLLTHKDNLSYLEYILKIKSHVVATLIKIEDLKHNLYDLKDGCLKDKYLMALYILEEV